MQPGNACKEGLQAWRLTAKASAARQHCAPHPAHAHFAPPGCSELLLLQPLCLLLTLHVYQRYALMCIKLLA